MEEREQIAITWILKNVQVSAIGQNEKKNVRYQQKSSTVRPYILCILIVMHVLCAFTQTHMCTFTLLHVYFTTKVVSWLTGSSKDNANTHTQTEPDHRCNLAPHWLRLNSSVCLSLSVSVLPVASPSAAQYTEKSIIENREHHHPEAIFTH